ncbi:type II toxin-antitoxin system RelE/ParE family toxin [Blastopirellula sp. J2-11]|uniref:type II toxin-antitoxin system RelE/ParE family toxin n=1 Tax=Blastopirellula sp. J2-11 TaxID=2943192 RepID=UPI0021C873D3|nr:type II toxin-antitoxin system RelE/ParE family toxin [Blastopirellula sp. J2-11]UUO06952.1 type II toxin-antitoxin system RelE/ParE family toxin [Blastopirellula sp. J2-11]
MSRLPFEYHPAAMEKSIAAYQWYAQQSVSAAERFWNELVRARTLISQRPQGWTPYYHGTRCFQFRKFPYGLVYLELPDKIVGLAVCHLSRRPGYWKVRK